MLDDYQIEKLFTVLSLPEEARQLVRSARKDSPVLQANSNLGNSITQFLSNKMGGKHLELWSRTVAVPAATLYENDTACLEFWPKPFKISLDITDPDGRLLTRNNHVPAFLDIRSNGIYVQEWREESRLLGFEKDGSQFFKDEEHRWHYRSAEDYFSKIGLYYQLHSAFELPRMFVQNVHFLEHYHLPSCPPLSEETKTKLLELLAERGSVPFLELIHDHDYAADSIFKAIVDKSVYVDLNANRLDIPANLVIHRDMAIARAYQIIKDDRRTPALPIPGMGRLKAGSIIKFNGTDFEVIIVEGDQVVLKNMMDGITRALPLDTVIELFARENIAIFNNDKKDKLPSQSLADYSKSQIETGIRRHSEITEGKSENFCERSIQIWKSKCAGATSKVDMIIALADHNQDKGNREPRLPEKVESLAEEAIRKYLNASECRTMLAVYQKYQLLCEEHKVEPMSYPTFTKRCKKMKSIKAREGKKKAYQEDAIPLILDYAFPINGAFPHDVCYMDHTILNLATVGEDASALGKPLFTVATDGHTTQTRAFYLCYEPPSAKVVLMTLRDYVRRNHRLPKILVVDGGKEFRSKELKVFCEYYGIALRHRPAGKPRGGSMVERVIGATETEVIAKMEGNTRIMKNARMVTKPVNPFSNAIWTLTATHGALEEYLFEIRDTRIHPALGLTPSDFESMRMKETGLREHTLVKFDENIMLMTCPHPKRWFHKIDRKRGVWADNAHYMHSDFKMARIREEGEVLVEPWMANVVYVYFRDRWVAAFVRNLKPYDGRTRYEVEIAIRTERRHAKVDANNGRLTKISAKKMIGLWAPEKFDERIGKQQREMKHLYGRLGMTLAMPALISTSATTEIISTPDIPIAERAPNTRAAGAIVVVNNDKAKETESARSSIWEGVDGYS